MENTVVIQKYDWIDALRGYAILLVLMIHTESFPKNSSDYK